MEDLLRLVEHSCVRRFLIPVVPELHSIPIERSSGAQAHVCSIINFVATAPMRTRICASRFPPAIHVAYRGGFAQTLFVVEQ